jgi:hypothetical protein
MALNYTFLMHGLGSCPLVVKCVHIDSLIRKFLFGIVFANFIRMTRCLRVVWNDHVVS